MEHSDRFFHDFPSCFRTYATLAIYHVSADPEEISEILQLSPDKTHKTGELLGYGKTARTTGWFLQTENAISSKDLRAHIEWILSKLSTKKNEFGKLIEKGFKASIWCFWDSASGSGGPIIDHELIISLSEYQINLYFDIYFQDGKRRKNKLKKK